MRFYILLFTTLTACSNIEQQNGGGDVFYTWVDERGMVHTQKKVQNPEKKTVPVVMNPEKHDDSRSVAKSSKSIGKAQEIITSDYTSSIDIDKKIAGDKLFSWTQDGRQIIAELDTGGAKKNSVDTESKTYNFDKQYSHFREGKEILLSEVFSKEIKLENTFITNKDKRTDYILIEVNIAGIRSLTFNSYIQDNKVALPLINFLQASYRSTAQITDVFDSFIEETWSSYGRFTGSVSIPSQTRYILIRPNPALGVIETGDGDITLMDLGVIQITH